MEDLEWNERLLVHNKTSEGVKLRILGRKADMVQEILTAKDMEIDRYNADAKGWKDILKETRVIVDNREAGSKEQA